MRLRAACTDEPCAPLGYTRHLGPWPIDLMFPNCRTSSKFWTPCCAQFATTGAMIKQHPRGFYERLYAFMAAEEKVDKDGNAHVLGNTLPANTTNIPYWKDQQLERAWGMMLSPCTIRNVSWADCSPPGVRWCF